MIEIETKRARVGGRVLIVEDGGVGCVALDTDQIEPLIEELQQYTDD